MNKTNLQPITNESQPTSHVKVGESRVKSSDVVRLEHRGIDAFFYAKPVEDFVGGIGNKVKFHDNVASLFGGIDFSSPFYVDAKVSKRDVEVCRTVELRVRGAPEEQIEQFMRESEYLVHNMEEVVSNGDDLVPVQVYSMEPSGYRTLRVTDDTDIEFVSRSDVEDRAPDGPGGAGGGSGDGAGPAGPGGPGGDSENDVDIDVTPKKPTKSFEEDVAGLDTVKRTARTMLAMFDPQKQSEVERRYGEGFASRGGSMLLYGPPGCGKTLVSEAIAHEAKNETDIEDEYGDVKFLEVKGGDVLSRYPGESERRIEAVFDQAHRVAQDGFAVLFFDEVETLIPDRSDDSLQRHERSLTNAFLQEMNDIEDNLLVIGATNMPFTIDPAATRRFPIQQFIPQPDAEVMAQVWEVNLRDLPDADEIDFRRLGEESVGYTPAEVADRVLGSDLQREFVESVVRPDREPITPDTEYLLSWLEDTEPKTVRQYVSSVREQLDDLEGYPEMQRYIEEQAAEHDISLGTGRGGLGELLASATGRGGGSDSAADESAGDSGGAEP
ncbi:MULTISPECIES: ATP-binding protein [Halorussus]|uniref:ATP-binding protein n=1 Tax=Halorussus TaxID=1070314 RepID=UPI000E216039|nr:MULTISPECIES: ATP-binding protein [Halorussus]NHN61194.1 ATP-binding protein [Halorussus sp. JP-T4]